MVLKFYLNLSKSKERLRVDLVGMVITFIGLQDLPNPLTIKPKMQFETLWPKY